MSERLKTYERDRVHEPRLHEGRGMMRVGELELIARVARNSKVKAYVEFGCGSNCFGLREVRQWCGEDIELYGFDVLQISTTIWKPLRAFIWSGHILEDHQLNEITVERCRAIIRNTPGPIMWLTDNGHKVSELRGIVQFARSGDVIATHDYSTEVVDASIPFLSEPKCRVMREVEKECEAHGYLLQFWDVL